MSKVGEEQKTTFATYMLKGEMAGGKPEQSRWRDSNLGKVQEFVLREPFSQEHAESDKDEISRAEEGDMSVPPVRSQI